MADIEQAGLFTGPIVRVSDAQVAVLDGHGVPAEWDELCAMLGVKIVERRLRWFWALCRLRGGIPHRLASYPWTEWCCGPRGGAPLLRNMLRRQ